MIDFHCPRIEDKKWIKEKVAKKDFPTCEYTFGNIFSYSAKMQLEVAEVCGFLVTKCYINNFITYCYPVGEGDIREAISLVIDDGLSSGKSFGFFGLSSNNARELEELFPGKFDITPERDSFDYIYSSEDLINLTGKKYQPKRNHISYFTKNNNWTYERMSEDNLEECYQMSLDWLERSRVDGHSDYISDLENELKIIKLVFDNFSELDFVGGLLRVDGRVVAYTMGEEMSKDAFCVHFEKAYADIRGAYPMINQQFVKNELSEYKYIDREDDVGLENLRKAKLSYYPVLLPEKYEARLR